MGPASRPGYRAAVPDSAGVTSWGHRPIAPMAAGDHRGNLGVTGRYPRARGLKVPGRQMEGVVAEAFIVGAVRTPVGGRNGGAAGGPPRPFPARPLRDPVGARRAR